jgi:hypothetical protein
MVKAAAEGRTNLLIFVEPPSADPHARWCGEGARQRAGLPDFVRTLTFSSFRGFARDFPFRSETDVKCERCTQAAHSMSFVHP